LGEKGLHVLVLAQDQPGKAAHGSEPGMAPVRYDI
jgi:hypothetical protein